MVRVLLSLVVIAVFLAGLMVGRTPEYLGKKVEAYEMKMAALVILIPPAVVLIGTAIAVVSPGGKATIFNPGTHGFSEVLYAFSSAGNNNGSAFAGLGADTPFYNTALGLGIAVFCMITHIVLHTRAKNIQHDLEATMEKTFNLLTLQQR